jgi:hypothetical protein
VTVLNFDVFAQANFKVTVAWDVTTCVELKRNQPRSWYRSNGLHGFQSKKMIMFSITKLLCFVVVVVDDDDDDSYDCEDSKAFFRLDPKVKFYVHLGVQCKF